MEAKLFLVLQTLDYELMVEGREQLGLIGEMENLLVAGVGYKFEGELTSFAFVVVNLRTWPGGDEPHVFTVHEFLILINNYYTVLIFKYLYKSFDYICIIIAFN